MVLSTIGGYVENQFVGTAIDADFYLYITEDNTHEMPDEEVHWISAAERADSIGVDVINTSLGYYDFDDSRYNYLYEDMDGQTTYISRGAQFAAEKELWWWFLPGMKETTAGIISPLLQMQKMYSPLERLIQIISLRFFFLRPDF